MRPILFCLKTAFLSCLVLPQFIPPAWSEDITISGKNNTSPVFSETAVNLVFEPNSALTIVDNDAVMIHGGSSVNLSNGAKISVANTISEGVGIHILAGDDEGSNNIQLDSGTRIQVVTHTVGSEQVYSEMQAGGYMPMFPIFPQRDSISTTGDGSSSYDNWEVNNTIESYNPYANASARGIVLEGANYFVGETTSALPPSLMHSIVLENTSVFVSASAHTGAGWAEARGVDIDLPETSNSIVELTLNNSHISAEATSTGGDGYLDNEYVYGGDGYISSWSNATGVYSSSDIIIDIDNTSSITGDWAVWGNPGSCVGWYLGCVDTVDSSQFATACINESDVAINNHGTLNGRILAKDLHNYAGGTLIADFNVQTETILNESTSLYYIGENAIGAVTPYFYIQNTILEDGSIFVLKPSGSFGLELGESNAVKLLYSDNGQWDIESLILRLEAESPLLEASWSELSDQNTLIVTTSFITPQQAGLSHSATHATSAALADGRFTFDSNPESWIPDISGAMTMGASISLRHSLGNLQNRISGMRGVNSGDKIALSQGLWYESGYSDADQEYRGNVNGFKAQTTHFSLGYDVEGDRALLGIAYTRSGTNLNGSNSGQKLDSTDHLFSLYGRYDFDSFFIQGFATFGRGNIDSYRAVGLQLFEAEVNSHLYAISSQAGIEIAVGDWIIEPMLSLEYDKQHFDKYQETGGLLALDVDSQDYEIFNIGGGATLKRNWTMKWGNVTPELTAMLYYDVIGDRMQAVSRFVGGQTSFISNGSDPAQTSWDVSPSITIETTGTSRMNFKLSYTYSGKEDFEASSISGKLRFVF